MGIVGEIWLLIASKSDHFLSFYLATFGAI